MFKYLFTNISRVPDQKGVSLLYYIMLKVHHSGRESSICFAYQNSLDYSLYLSKLKQLTAKKSHVLFSMKWFGL